MCIRDRFYGPERLLGVSLRQLWPSTLRRDALSTARPPTPRAVCRASRRAPRPAGRSRTLSARRA
eukprot:8758441-Pyramimonas_sp.AAC.1